MGGIASREHGADQTVAALVVVPPPSPSNTNPPLGPAILSRVALKYGVNVRVIDLNADFIGRFDGVSGRRPSFMLGDHGKDRKLVATAADWLFRNSALRNENHLHLPVAADPAAGMHYSFESIFRAVDLATRSPDPWRSWIESRMFDVQRVPPAVVGVSLMGPSQVFLGLVILKLVKENWPSTLTVMGGSHVTLLAGELHRESRYRRWVDVVLPGHSEVEFATLLRRRLGVPAVETPAEEFEYTPLFEAEQLSLYEQDTLTLPLQFTRGCAYGRCTFCTYPAVEPVLTKLRPVAARDAVRYLTARHNVRSFSLKDSLFTGPMLRAFAEAITAPDRLDVRWSATTKLNRGLLSLASLLLDSGLTTLEVGVETIHRRGQALFDKRADTSMMEDVILAYAEMGVCVVVNLIFGLPGESDAEAEQQLQWFCRLRGQAPPGRIDGSLNLLEIVRGSPLANTPHEGLELQGISPWAYCYKWNAPTWRNEFAPRLREAELL